MDIFVYGHGFNINPGTTVNMKPGSPRGTLNHNIKDEVDVAAQTFMVPPNFTIKFYIQNGTEFDTAMEPVILKKYFANRIIPNANDYTVQRSFYPQGKTGDTDFNLDVAKLKAMGEDSPALLSSPECYQGVQCDNYIATRPGNSKTVKPEAAVKSLVPASAACSISPAGVADLDFLAVKVTNHPHTYLSSIVNAVQAIVPQNTQVVVNWMLCRSLSLISYPDDDVQDDFWGDIVGQAKKKWETLQTDMQNMFTRGT
jgi:hypothetical protein